MFIQFSTDQPKGRRDPKEFPESKEDTDLCAIGYAADLGHDRRGEHVSEISAPPPSCLHTQWLNERNAEILYR